MSDSQLLHAYLHLGIRVFVFAPELLGELECLPGYLDVAVRVIESQELTCQNPATTLLDQALKRNNSPTIFLWLQQSLGRLLSVLMAAVLRAGRAGEIASLARVLHDVLAASGSAGIQTLSVVLNEPSVVPAMLPPETRMQFLQNVSQHLASGGDVVRINALCVSLNSSCRSLGLIS